MKVVCINSKDCGTLTTGKTYDTYQTLKTIYYIKNDFGIIFGYDRSYFKSVEDIRNEKLDELLN